MLEFRAIYGSKWDLIELVLLIAIALIGIFFGEISASVGIAVAASLFTGICTLVANEYSNRQERLAEDQNHSIYVKNVVNAVLREIERGQSRMQTIYDTPKSAKKTKMVPYETPEGQFGFGEPGKIPNATYYEGPAIEVSNPQYSTSKIYTGMWDSSMECIAGNVNTQYFKLLHDCYIQFNLVNISLDLPFKDKRQGYRAAATFAIEHRQVKRNLRKLRKMDYSI